MITESSEARVLDLTAPEMHGRAGATEIRRTLVDLRPGEPVEVRVDRAALQLVWFEAVIKWLDGAGLVRFTGPCASQFEAMFMNLRMAFGAAA